MTTVWWEILMGRHCGRLLKLWRWNLFGGWASLSHNDSKMLWPDTWSYQSDAEIGNRLPKSSLVSDWQWYQCLRSYTFGFPSSSFYLRVQNSLEMWCPCTAAVDGEFHADDLIEASSYRPIVHVEAMIMQKWWHHTESLGHEILTDSSKNRHSTKIYSPPNFSAIHYFCKWLLIAVYFECQNHEIGWFCAYRKCLFMN